MNQIEELELVLKEIGAEDEGWLVENESVLLCPCGHRVELDGTCPEGCVSPLREVGLI